MPTVPPVNTTGTPYATASFTQSGVAGVVGIATGQGIVFSVVPFIASGAAAVVAGQLELYDAVSGAAATPGLARFFYLNPVAGLSGDAITEAVSINAPFFSGLNLYGSGLTAGLGVSVFYRTGI